MSPQILLVEDEHAVARTISKMLERSGYTVPTVASSGEEAIRKAADIRPDLVLMDITLAGPMDGVDAAVRIHRDLHLPIIYLTGLADEVTLQRAKEAEPFGYLLKPVGVEELHSAITMALHNVRIRNQQRQQGGEGRALDDARISATVEDLWQSVVNFFERWDEYDRTVQTPDASAANGNAEDAMRMLVVLADRELRHATELFRETLARSPHPWPEDSNDAAQGLWSASEQYFSQQARCEESTRSFQERKASFAEMKRECTLAKIAQDKLREAAIRFRYSRHLVARFWGSPRPSSSAGNGQE